MAGGDAVIDECGNCEGQNLEYVELWGECFGGAMINECGFCLDEFYACSDLMFLQSVINNNSSLEGQYALDIGYQQWQNGHLRILSLEDMSLTQIPGSIANLDSILSLSFWGNELTTLPGNIGSLTTLIELGVNNNQLTNLPNSISNLSNLEILHAGSNQITVIAPSICDLPAECNITLTDNNLCEEYHYQCIDVWGGQNQTNCDECGVTGGNNESCSGCMDELADNYNMNAIIENDTCQYSSPMASPIIDNIVDIPQDQGGYVGLQYQGSIFDYMGTKIIFM